jgi:hypothetical protein
MIVIEEIGDYIKYECPISQSVIIFVLEHLLNNTFNLKFSEMNINWEQPKLFINLLKYSLDDVQNKYHIEDLIQTVSVEEWNLMKKENFTVIKEYNIDEIACIDISCDIENSLQNIVDNLFRE